jgi:hypothetical protein
MKKREVVSTAELGALLQRLYLRLELYEIRAGSLPDSPQRHVARVLAGRVRDRMADVSALLDRRLADAIGQGAHTPADRKIPPATRACTAGNLGRREVPSFGAPALGVVGHQVAAKLSI